MMQGMWWLAAIALVAGCGEPALCTRDVSLAIETARTIVSDIEPGSDGVQTTVNVATTMGAGATVALDVIDDTGAIVLTLTSTTDIAGVASFGTVTVPAPLAELRAAASN